MDHETKPMNTKELTQAVSRLLESEERRESQRRKRQRRKARERREQLDASIQKLAHSIEVIKWCIISITTVMVLALLVVIMVVMEVEREAERIKGEVEQIKQEAVMIRDKIRHPFETLGSNLGRRLENILLDNEQ
jgi:predicted RND superfamily exporter protein